MRLLTVVGVIILAAISGSGQIMIDNFAGGHIVSGTSAQSVAFGPTSGITRDPNGDLVVCDFSNHVIRRINADGTVQTIAGTGIPGYGGDGGLATAALLRGPAFPKYDAAGNLYFGDNGRIRRVDTSGVIRTVAGTGIMGTLGTGGSALLAQTYYILDLVIDDASYIYFAEDSQPLLRRITPSGRVEVFAGCASCNDVDGAPATQSSIGNVVAMSVDSRRNLYLASTNGGQGHVYRISADGIIHHFAGFGSVGLGPQSGNGGPALAASPSQFLALFADHAGNVYTEESLYGCAANAVIRRIGTDGNINVVAGSLVCGSSPSDGPALQVGLGVGGASSLFVKTDGTLSYGDSHVIQQSAAQAMIQTIAGGQPQPAPDGTPALSAWFVQPNSIAINRAGELYVGQPCIIQKIGSDGVLSTIAGTGQCSYTAPTGPALMTQLRTVESIVVDSHNQVYFVDLNGTLYMVSTEGSISIVVDSTFYGGPYPLAIDSRDRIYLLGYFPPFLGLIVPGSAFQSINLPYSPYNGSPFESLSLTVDTADNVYVCCEAPSTILRYPPDLRSNGTTLNVPMLPERVLSSMAVDSSSNIWQGYGYSGLGKDGVRFGSYVSTSLLGPALGAYGDGGPAESAYIAPLALAIAPNSDLYELDAATNSIRRIHGSPPTDAPAISAGGIVNAASLAGGTIAPGELISIFGSNFGPAGLDVARLENNSVPTALNNVHVNFGPYAGAITARTANQVNVFVPYEIAKMTSTQVVVDVDGITSAPATVAVAPSVFGLSTADSSGSGQGAILNQDGAYNSQSNPAAPGSIVTMFGTGEGVTAPALPDGALEISTPYSTTQAPIIVKFGGETATIEYDGAAPYLPTGVFQINAIIPDGVTPGDVPITVSIDGIGTTRTVTVAVR